MHRQPKEKSCVHAAEPAEKFAMPCPIFRHTSSVDIPRTDDVVKSLLEFFDQPCYIAWIMLAISIKFDECICIQYMEHVINAGQICECYPAFCLFFNEVNGPDLAHLLTNYIARTVA